LSYGGNSTNYSEFILTISLKKLKIWIRIEKNEKEK